MVSFTQGLLCCCFLPPPGPSLLNLNLLQWLAQVLCACLCEAHLCLPLSQSSPKESGVLRTDWRREAISTSHPVNSPAASHNSRHCCKDNLQDTLLYPPLPDYYEYIWSNFSFVFNSMGWLCCCQNWYRVLFGLRLPALSKSHINSSLLLSCGLLSMASIILSEVNFLISRITCSNCCGPCRATIICTWLLMIQ